MRMDRFLLRLKQNRSSANDDVNVRRTLVAVRLLLLSSCWGVINGSPIVVVVVDDVVVVVVVIDDDDTSGASSCSCGSSSAGSGSGFGSSLAISKNNALTFLAVLADVPTWRKPFACA